MNGAYPGLYLFTSPSRFVRPVRNISAPAEEGNDLELIGPFEQVGSAFLAFPLLNLSFCSNKHERDELYY